jgi:hypothetical protein
VPGSRLAIGEVAGDEEQWLSFSVPLGAITPMRACVRAGQAGVDDARRVSRILVIQPGWLCCTGLV